MTENSSTLQIAIQQIERSLHNNNYILLNIMYIRSLKQCYNAVAPSGTIECLCILQTGCIEIVYPLILVSSIIVLCCLFPDIDECSLFASSLCQHTCRNTLGSYECGCRDGFELILTHLCIGIIISNVYCSFWYNYNNFVAIAYTCTQERKKQKYPFRQS